MNIEQQILQFNKLHTHYKEKLPKEDWTEKFKENLKIDFTYYSNQLEGNNINYGDTISFLKTGLINTNLPASIKDLKDLENHQNLLNEIFLTYSNITLEEKTIKALHGKLMKDPVQWAGKDGLPINDALNIIGDYRIDEVYGTREFGTLKEYVSHFEISKKMEALLTQHNHNINLLNVANINTHPLYVLAQFHQSFVNDIHPFKNGNGRMVRLLTNIELMKLNYPPLLIKNKENYVDAIIECEKTNTLFPMLKIFIADLTENMTSQLEQTKC